MYKQDIDIEGDKIQKTLRQMQEWDKERLLGTIEQALVIQQGNLQEIDNLKDRLFWLENALKRVEKLVAQVSTDAQNLEVYTNKVVDEFRD